MQSIPDRYATLTMTSPATIRNILLAEDYAADKVLVREALRSIEHPPQEPVMSPELLGGIVEGILAGIASAAGGGA